MKRAAELKDRAMASTTVLAAAGGSLGALVGALLARKRARASARKERFHRQQVSEKAEQARGEAAAGPADATERVSDAGVTLSEQAVEAGAGLRERAAEPGDENQEPAAGVRERLSSRGEAKARTAGWYHQKVDQQPLLLALGSMALGMASAFLFPVTRLEHEAVASLKEHARAKLRAQGVQLPDRHEEKPAQPDE